MVNLCVQALQGYIAHDGEGGGSGGEEDKEGGGGGGGGGKEGGMLWDLHSALDLLLIKHPHLKEAISKIFCACHTLTLNSLSCIFSPQMLHQLLLIGDKEALTVNFINVSGIS